MLGFPGLPITSRELYERLKKRGVLIISGHYFFFGHDDESRRHRHECLRTTFTMDEGTVRRGIQAIGEAKRSWQGGPGSYSRSP